MPAPNTPKKTPKKRQRQNRRARGSGSIFYSEKRKLWIGRRPTGRTAAGRTTYRQVSARTQSEVVMKLNAASPPGPDTTVAEWGARWLAGLTVRGSSLESYTTTANLHIIPALGPTRVRDVTASQVNTLLKKLVDGGMAGTTARNVRTHGRIMFNAARVDRLVTENPFALARRPNAEKKAVRPFSPAELQDIIADAADLSAGPLIILLAATGCRLGEAAALDVGDWDAVAGTISITKTYSHRFGLGPPKSRHSHRTITVPMAARPALLAAIRTRTAGPMFRTQKNRRVSKSLAQRAFRRVLSRLKLDRRNVHQLRHSVATALITDGGQLGDVAKYLGDTIEVVVKTYLHPSGSDPGKQLDKLLTPTGRKVTKK